MSQPRVEIEFDLEDVARITSEDGYDFRANNVTDYEVYVIQTMWADGTPFQRVTPIVGRGYGLTIRVEREAGR